MFEQFVFYLGLVTLLFLSVICGLMVLAYRHRQARRSAPPMLWGFQDSDNGRYSQANPSAPRHRLIATIGYADRSKLVNRN